MSEVSYFVMGAGRGQEKGTAICLIASRTRVKAHAEAAKAYRESLNLAPGIHVDTHVLCQEAEEADAALFMARLLFKMDEDQKDAHIHSLNKHRTDDQEQLAGDPDRT